MKREKFASDTINDVVRFPTKWLHVQKLRLEQLRSKDKPTHKLLLSCLTQAYEIRKILFRKPLFSDPKSLSEWRLLQSQHRRALKQNIKNIADHKIYLSKAIFINVDLGGFPNPVDLIDLTEIERFGTGCIYILNNNDVIKIGLKKYINMYLNSPDSLIAIWDFDNHHNLAPTFSMAAFCDLYIPCHEQNIGQIAQLNESISAPTSAAVIQWSRQFLKDNISIIANTTRHTEPLGRHIFYKEFWTRNSNAQKLKKWFEHVGLFGDNYHQLNHEDRLREWSSHMTHWVLPTFNDVPIRIFDALITGGIPLAPLTLRNHPSLMCVKEHVFFYDEADLDDPRTITQAANERFISQGIDGILKRHQLAMEQGHIDGRVAQMIALIEDNFRAADLY